MMKSASSFVIGMTLLIVGLWGYLCTIDWVKASERARRRALGGAAQSTSTPSEGDRTALRVADSASLAHVQGEL